MKEGYGLPNEEEIAICKKAQITTEKNAVFIIPFEFTAMKFYGQRSCYVEFKAIAKNQRDIALWYQRIQRVYGLNYQAQNSGFALREQANSFLNNLQEEQLTYLQVEGVTHLICQSAAYQKQHQLLGLEGGYYLYKL